MNVRAMVGSLQIPIAVVGTLLIVFSVGAIVMIPSPPPGSEGFVSGLAFIFLYFLGWIGFLALSFGLAIPPGGGYGIRFNRYQRALFVLSGLAGILSAVGPFVAFGVLLSHPSLIGTAWVAIMGVGLLALTAGLLWRGVQAVQTWRFNNESTRMNN